MTTVRLLLAAVAGFAAALCSAASGSDSFAFPTAILKISSPSWQRSAEIEVSKAPNGRGSVTKIAGSPQSPVPTRSEPMSWQFVGKSNYGDVYVFAFQKADGGKEIVSAVFDGASPVIFERRNLKVEISVQPQ
jgi:hypothetical protein